MATVESALAIVMLAGLIWALAFWLPKARREHDTFGVTCALLTAFVALIGLLYIGIGVGSR